MRAQRREEQGSGARGGAGTRLQVEEAPSSALSRVLRCRAKLYLIRAQRCSGPREGVRMGVRDAPTDCHLLPRVLCVTTAELLDRCMRTVPSIPFP